MKKNKKVVVVKNKKIQDSFGKSKKNPKSAQDTLPWDEVYTNGVYRQGNVFSIRFFIDNINYKMKKDREKDITYEKYQNLLSALPTGINYQEFIVNKPFDRQVLSDTMIPTEDKNSNVKSDTLTDYQEVMQGKIDECLSKACNQLVLGVISYEPKTKLDDVNILFKYYDELDVIMQDMGTKIRLVTTEESFEILHSIYHPFDDEPFLLPDNFLQHDTKLKDYIAPSHFTFKSKMTEIGSAYCTIMFVRHFSKTCDDEFIIDLLNNTYNIAVSKQLLKIDKSEAFEILKRQMQDLEGRLEKRREVNHKHGGEYIPFSLQDREKELKALQNKLGNSNCDLFEMGLYIMISAKTEDELGDLMLFIKQKALAHQVKLDVLSGSKSQENGLRCVLPFANPVLNSDDSFFGQPYYILTDEVANFIPFSYRNVFSRSGIYYGINKISKAPIIIDRSENMNGNAFILGPSGSGKSMNVKSELYAAMMKYPLDEFIIIDPENEYAPLIDVFDGEIIKVSPDTQNHLNIFDTDLSFVEDGTNAVTLKTDFIMTFVEAVKSRGLTPNERTLIDRCVQKVFSDYQMGKTEDMPTLPTFYDELLKCSEPEAESLATALELYVKGSFNIFAHKTNVSYHKKFIVFDISEMGEQLKTVGTLVILELLWQRVIYNKKRGVRTWVGTDEFSVMFNDNGTHQIFSTGLFFAKVYKRIRKYGGNALGATQNITEVLASDQAKTMLNNSDFIMLLKQNPSDLKQIIKHWDLAESQARYLDTDDVGTGLIISGKNIIPFENIIPSDSLMYKNCTTKFQDIKDNLKQ